MRTRAAQAAFRETPAQGRAQLRSRAVCAAHLALMPSARPAMSECAEKSSASSSGSTDLVPATVKSATQSVLDACVRAARAHDAGSVAQAKAQLRRYDTMRAMLYDGRRTTPRAPARAAARCVRHVIRLHSLSSVWCLRVRTN
eukprot:6178236-Pleurochrysis_carterae.AAC.4